MNVCMVPVRKGSVRLAKKNYLKLGGLTIFEIAVQKALASGAFDRVVINTDDPELEIISRKIGADWYLRPDELATSSATSDEVVHDFFAHHEGKKVFWVNTASPLQTVHDIRNFVSVADASTWSSGVSYNPMQVHTFFDGQPLNFDWENGFARTQDLKVVKCFNYAMMGWSREMMPKLSRRQLFDENTYLVKSSKWSSFLLKTEEDLDLITSLYQIAPDQGRATPSF